MFYAFASIGIGAALGAWLRWWFGLTLNSIFPTIPLGTLTANLVGGFLIGIFMAITKHHSSIPEVVRLAITTGFLGGLTTFSTFSAELMTLLSGQEYFWSGLLITAHVAGSLFAAILGIYTFKLFTS